MTPFSRHAEENVASKDGTDSDRHRPGVRHENDKGREGPRDMYVAHENSLCPVAQVWRCRRKGNAQKLERRKPAPGGSMAWHQGRAALKTIYDSMTWDLRSFYTSHDALRFSLHRIQPPSTTGTHQILIKTTCSDHSRQKCPSCGPSTLAEGARVSAHDQHTLCETFTDQCAV